MLQTDQQFPSISSQKKGAAINADASVDVYFGPTPPPGKEGSGYRPGPGQGLDRHSSPLRSAAAVFRQDVEAQRD